MEPTDGQLLRDYVTGRSEAAFGALVERHIRTVYSIARRKAGERLAEDVTQAVFIVLARKAPGLLEVRTLGGWLHRVTRYAAADAMRKNLRRAHHERRAARGAVEMGGEAAEFDAVRVDEALALLATADREALILRFYQDASFGQMGVALGISESAAKKRTDRALARMKRMLKRGTAALAVVPVLARGAGAAPAGLARSVTAQVAGSAGLWERVWFWLQEFKR